MRSQGSRSAACLTAHGTVFHHRRLRVRFAQMLLNGGQLDGVRLLGRKNGRPDDDEPSAGLPRLTIGGDDADVFGLGGAVRLTSPAPAAPA